MVVPLLIYFRRPEIAPALRASCCWLLLPTQKAARRSSRCEVDGLRFSLCALLLADHRASLLGSPWFDPDAKPRMPKTASVSRPLASAQCGPHNSAYMSVQTVQRLAR